MPVKINCPRCNATMNMPESMYGKAVRCPSCKSPFQCPSAPPSARPAPAAAPPPQARGGGSANPFAFDEPVIAATPAAEYDHEDPYAYRPRPRRRGWDAVAGGFLFLYISAPCFLLAVVMEYVPTEPPSRDTGKILAILTLVLLLAGYVLGVLGVFRCASAPRDSGASLTAVLSGVLLLISGVLALFVFTIHLLAALGDPPEISPKVMFWSEMLQPATLIASWGLFLVFLIQAAQWVKRRGAATGATWLLALFPIAAIVELQLATVIKSLGEVMMGGDMRGMGGRGGLAGLALPSPETLRLILLMTPAVVFIWFMIQLVVIQAAIRSRRSRGVA